MRLFKRKPGPMVCRQAVEAVTAYLEDAMDPRDRARFETHLAACPHCATYVEQIRITIAVTGTVEAGDLSPAARSALSEVFTAWSAGA